MEIERKFLVKALPPGLKPASEAPIRQGYFLLCDRAVEIRLREKASKHFITIKAGHGRVRLEEELPISTKTFRALWPLVRSTCIVKKRRRIRYESVVIEVDIYQGRHRGLIIAEIEFNSRRQAHAFKPPRWLGREITGHRRYANESLAH